MRGVLWMKEGMVVIKDDDDKEDEDGLLTWRLSIWINFSGE